MPPDDVILAKVEIIDLLVVQRLIEHRLEDLARFCQVALAL
jgi:hypothetical protein